MTSNNLQEQNYLFHASADDFKKIPGSPIAYWISEKQLLAFSEHKSLENYAISSNGVQTGDNSKYVRSWYEISFLFINKIWFPYNKGGQFRKWYGNFDFVVYWHDNGAKIKSENNSCTRGENFYFEEGITWSDITSGNLSCRYLPKGFIFDASGPSAFFKNKEHTKIGLSLLNTKFANYWSKILNPTLHFQSGDFRKLVLSNNFINNDVVNCANECIFLSKSDWDAYETSWDFTDNPLIRTQQPTLEQAFTTWQTQNTQTVAEMKRLEEENNRLFIEAYGLQDELTPDVPDEQITLSRADSEKDSQRLISYAIGCMMGRYSLDEPGLIYANAGNVGFDSNRYNRFAADADGIVPITDMLWFEDDATNRLKDFLIAVWGEQMLEQNLTWLATQLGTKAGESAEDSIRRYLSDKFYKDHLQTYKKRPIYWHFSSGKQGAFQALVYLHRYNESTLARMRAEYVVPLMGKLQNRIEMTEKDASVAGSTATRKKLALQVESLRKKHLELLAFDEKLRHYADMRITLDLDDGVKVNYGKFGDLLSDVKAITGGKDE